MSDLIRRADAMGAVQDHFNADGFKGYDDGQKMMDRINALPSADAVSREQPDYCIAYGSGVCGYPIEQCAECPKHDYYKCLPEIVRCKDCKYRDTNYGQAENDECRWLADERPNDDDFCSYGERREP